MCLVFLSLSFSCEGEWKMGLERGGWDGLLGGFSGREESRNQYVRESRERKEASWRPIGLEEKEREGGWGRKRPSFTFLADGGRGPGEIHMNAGKNKSMKDNSFEI